MYGLIGFKNGAGNEIKRKSHINTHSHTHTHANRTQFIFVKHFNCNVENQIDK